MVWNINSVRTKLEKQTTQALLNKYDIVGLIEVKTKERIHLPGYICYRKSDASDGHRGGTVVLVRRALQSSVISVDTSKVDQVWIRLTMLANVLLGIVYVPPIDSRYFNPKSFSDLQEKIIQEREENKNVLIMGDLNARFGVGVRDILPSISTRSNIDMSYPIINDPINRPNDNANTMSSICMDNNLIVVNNLKMEGIHFQSKLTYRKGNEWVSELDTCIASVDILKNIEGFCVYDDLTLPSDHAPIAVSLSPTRADRAALVARARGLGDHATLHSSCNHANLVKRPLKFNTINVKAYVDFRRIYCLVKSKNIIY